MIGKSLGKVGAAVLTAVLLATPAAVLASGMEKAAGQATEMADKAAAMVEQLNLNTASVDALANIPGIGPKVAEAIGAYREAHGAFKSVADLVNVEGIDAGLLEKITPYLSI